MTRAATESRRLPADDAPPVRVQWLLVAAAAALALLSYFALVVHEATRRGDVMRQEQRMTGQLGPHLVPGRAPAGAPLNRR